MQGYGTYVYTAPAACCCSCGCYLFWCGPWLSAQKILQTQPGWQQDRATVILLFSVFTTYSVSFCNHKYRCTVITVSRQTCLIFFGALWQYGASLPPVGPLISLKRPQQCLLLFIVPQQDPQAPLCLSLNLIVKDETERALLWSHLRAQEPSSFALGVAACIHMEVVPWQTYREEWRYCITGDKAFPFKYIPLPQHTVWWCDDDHYQHSEMRLNHKSDRCPWIHL